MLKCSILIYYFDPFYSLKKNWPSLAKEKHYVSPFKQPSQAIILAFNRTVALEFLLSLLLVRHHETLKSFEDQYRSRHVPFCTRKTG